MRNWKETLQWYRTHQTASQIGFNPDGMCLKVCRTARDIGARFLTAKQAQDATPKEHRVYKVRNLRRGMIAYFDTVGDSNTAGHIVTIMGRVKGADLDDLHDVIVETNSVKSGELVRVRGDYFGTHWGDKFQFGATWLNGVELDWPKPKPKPPVGAARIENFRESRPDWDLKIIDRLVDMGRRDLKVHVDALEQAVRDLPDDRKDTRINEFQEVFKDKRVLKMKLLNAAVRDGRMQLVKRQRDKMRTIIKKIIL